MCRLIIILLIASLIGCSDPVPSEKKSSTKKITPTIVLANYQILKDNKNNNFKRSVDVLLDQKVNKNMLKSLAYKIKKSDSNVYARTFIGYYVKEVDRYMYWATTHFNPDIKIVINGLSLKDVKVLIKPEKSKKGKKVIGLWLLEWYKSKIQIYKLNNKLYVKIYFLDGSISEIEIIKYQNKGETRMKAKDKEEHDLLIADYLIINMKNELELWVKEENGEESMIYMAFLLNNKANQSN